MSFPISKPLFLFILPFLLFLLFLFPSSTQAIVLSPGTEITQDTVWTATSAPDLTSFWLCPVHIYPQATLTIKAGTIIKLADACFFDVEGKLIIKGTSSFPVVLTGVNDKDYLPPNY